MSTEHYGLPLISDQFKPRRAVLWYIVDIRRVTYHVWTYDMNIITCTHTIYIVIDCLTVWGI